MSKLCANRYPTNFQFGHNSEQRNVTQHHSTFPLSSQLGQEWFWGRGCNPKTISGYVLKTPCRIPSMKWHAGSVVQVLHMLPSDSAAEIFFKQTFKTNGALQVRSSTLLVILPIQIRRVLVTCVPTFSACSICWGYFTDLFCSPGDNFMRLRGYIMGARTP